MAAAGVFGEDERLELVDGEIVPMSPKGARHQSAVRRTGRQLRRVFAEAEWTIMEDSALALSDHRERYPDLLVVRGGDAEYDERVAEAADVVLAIEVSDTTLALDRDQKGREYAAANIPEYWIVNLPQRCLEVYGGPGASGYARGEIFGPSDLVGVEGAPGAAVLVADLLPLR